MRRCKECLEVVVAVNKPNVNFWPVYIHPRNDPWRWPQVRLLRFYGAIGAAALCDHGYMKEGETYVSTM